MSLAESKGGQLDDMVMSPIKGRGARARIAQARLVAGRGGLRREPAGLTCPRVATARQVASAGITREEEGATTPCDAEGPRRGRGEVAWRMGKGGDWPGERVVARAAGQDARSLGEEPGGGFRLDVSPYARGVESAGCGDLESAGCGDFRRGHSHHLSPPGSAGWMAGCAERCAARCGKIAGRGEFAKSPESAISLPTLLAGAGNPQRRKPNLWWGEKQMRPGGIFGQSGAGEGGFALA